MLSLVEMRPNSAAGANGCRPLSLPPRLGGLLLAAAEQNQADSQLQLQPTQSGAGGKLPTAKASRNHLSLSERAHNRRSWHLNGARDRLATLSITLATSTARNSSDQLLSPTNPSADLRLAAGNTSERDDVPEMRPASRILPHLFIGSERDASDLARLDAMRIGYVLNVTSHIPFHFEDRPGLVYQRIAASDSDSQDLKRHFQTAIEFIERARQANVACLVHCVAGVSRSPTIVLAYLMATRGWSMMEAYNFVKDRRSWIAPNLNFVGQLYDFERDLVRCNRLRSDRAPPSLTLTTADSDCSSDRTENDCAENKCIDMSLRPSCPISRPSEDVALSDCSTANTTVCTTELLRDRKSADTNGFRTCDPPTRGVDMEHNYTSMSLSKSMSTRSLRDEPDRTELCRSVKRRHEYYALTATCSSSLVCGMQTD